MVAARVLLEHAFVSATQFGQLGQCFAVSPHCIIPVYIIRQWTSDCGRRRALVTKSLRKVPRSKW